MFFNLKSLPMLVRQKGTGDWTHHDLVLLQVQQPIEMKQFFGFRKLQILDGSHL